MEWAHQWKNILSLQVVPLSLQPTKCQLIESSLQWSHSITPLKSRSLPSWISIFPAYQLGLLHERPSKENLGESSRFSSAVHSQSVSGKRVQTCRRLRPTTITTRSRLRAAGDEITEKKKKKTELLRNHGLPQVAVDWCRRNIFRLRWRWRPRRRRGEVTHKEANHRYLATDRQLATAVVGAVSNGDTHDTNFSVRLVRHNASDFHVLPDALVLFLKVLPLIPFRRGMVRGR